MRKLTILLLTIALLSCSKPGKIKPLPTANRIFYEIFIQSFADSDNDGIGDINGVIGKLDYLKELGISGIWLLPVHPSPTYHKYDVTNYKAIHPDYGTMADFKRLVEEAHKRDIAVILDMVFNHTSSQHSWFKEAVKSKESPYRDYYVWSSDSVEMLKNFHHWRNIADVDSSYEDDKKFYGFFWHTMPDLNYDNPKVREEIKQIGRFWLKDIGIDGFRLDAIRFIYPEDENTKNYNWWREFRGAMDEIAPGNYMVAEIWGEDSIVAPFLDKGVHSGFNFELADAIIKSVKEENNHGVVNTLNKSREKYRKVQWSGLDAVFLRNHDQNRTINEVGGSKAKAKLSAAIQLTLPGIPFIYYGEEIGMAGIKPDEYIREPFLWGKTAPENTHCMVSKYSTYEKINSLEQQKQNSESVYNYYKKLLQFRLSYSWIATAECEEYKIFPDSEKIIAYKLNSKRQKELIVLHNLSSEIISVQLEQTEEIVFPEKNKKGKKIELKAFSTLILQN